MRLESRRYDDELIQKEGSYGLAVPPAGRPVRALAVIGEGAGKVIAEPWRVREKQSVSGRASGPKRFGNTPVSNISRIARPSIGSWNSRGADSWGSKGAGSVAPKRGRSTSTTVAVGMRPVQLRKFTIESAKTKSDSKERGRGRWSSFRIGVIRRIRGRSTEIVCRALRAQAMNREVLSGHLAAARLALPLLATQRRAPLLAMSCSIPPSLTNFCEGLGAGSTGASHPQLSAGECMSAYPRAECGQIKCSVR